MKIKCVCECVCVNLVDVVCAIGMYELIVLSPGGGVKLTRQIVQIVPELGAEGWCVGHPVTRQKETEHFIFLNKIISTHLSNKISAVSVERHLTTYL